MIDLIVYKPSPHGLVFNMINPSGYALAVLSSITSNMTSFICLVAISSN